MWIILKKDSTLTDKDIKEFCNGNIVDYKIPRYIKFVKEFPVTDLEKVDKKQMKAISIKELNL